MGFGANPVLKRLGLAETDRVAVVHTDDIGMCEASVRAYAELIEAGTVTCGSVMVPCPWAPAAAALCARNPAWDMGVHATLTAEWEHYRWGPITTRDPATGLIDGDGFFPRTSEAVQATADPLSARIELKAQVHHAKAMGIAVSHVDTHMGSALSAALLPHYIEVALEAGAVPFALRLDEAQWRQAGHDEETATAAVAAVHDLEERGVPVLDRIAYGSLDDPSNRFEVVKALFDAIRPGHVGYIVSHPSVDTPELRAITPDWPARVADYETFRREDLRDHIDDAGIHLVSYRRLQSLMG